MKMNVDIEWQGGRWQANLAEPLPISIPLRNGEQNPNCYYADPVEMPPITGDGFIGDMQQGGSVNHKKIILSPHGNGTHTECFGHITNSGATIADQVIDYFHLAQLISVEPVKVNNDLVVNAAVLTDKTIRPGIKSLVIRSLPNDDSKLSRNYSGTNPIYFTEDAMQLIVGLGVEHLVTDLPSVDKEQDEGRLVAHKTFWKIGEDIRKKATITELAYIPASIPDGIFLLNLQVLPFHLDVSPSNPVLFALIQL